MGGGDLAVLLEDSEGGQALIRFLATPEAAEVWAGLGGYISPNKNVDISAYTDPVDQRVAQGLIDAGDTTRYDLSDLQPTAFGATTGQGIWGILTDFARIRPTLTARRRSWRLRPRTPTASRRHGWAHDLTRRASRRSRAAAEGA